MDDKKKKLLILVVEDEADMMKALKIRLEASNYEVVLAHDGSEGLNMARQEQPDLVVLDIMLPKMDGLTICRMLKFDEKFSKIPVILLTAKTQKIDIQRGKEMGADVYMTKPFKAEELLAAIEKLLKNKTG
ncbi:MAG: response regulator [bacterium]